MFEQSRRLSEPLRWGRREKTLVAALLACLALALVGLGVYALTGGSPKRRGCIEVTFASTLGGAELKACGSRARAICAAPQDYHSIRGELESACERARLPYAQR